MRHGGRAVERLAVLAAIIAAHVLFLEILIRNGKSYGRSSSHDSERSELFFLEIPPLEKPPAPSETEAVAQRQRARAPEASNAITMPREEKPPPIAGIDWFGDAAA